MRIKLIVFALLFAAFSTLATAQNSSKFDSDDFLKLEKLKKIFSGKVKDPPVNFDFTFPLVGAPYKKVQLVYLDKKSRPAEVYVFRSESDLLKFVDDENLKLHPLKKKGKADCKKEGTISTCDKDKKAKRMFFVVE